MAADDLEKDNDKTPIEQTPEQLASYWLNQIEFAEKKLKQFRTRGRQIVRRYKNKRSSTANGVPLAQRRMNVLWSNVQTQKPVMFNQMPKANVSRRNKTKDPVGRQASIVLQNVLQNSIAMENPQADFAYVMGQVVDDCLLPGEGLAMVEYVPEIVKDQIGTQAANTVYVHWEDWLTNVARTWQEVWWFGRLVYQTRKEVYQTVLKATGDQKAAEEIRTEITLDHSREDKTKDDGTDKARVYTIWDSKERQVLILSPGYKKSPLAVLKQPPVNFDGFFPIPRPLQATVTTDSSKPTPDFDQYVDQADEIDMLTQRIAMLAKSLRLRGIYPADMEAVKELMEAGDQDLIPYDQWQMIQERGGIEALVLWFPVETIAATLVQCYNAREQAIQVMYQITGISDIVRGATDAAETATAQQLKAQFGGIRIRERQKDVQRFIRDILRKKAEIIAEHFTLENIQAMSGVKLLTQQQKQTIQQAQQYMAQFEAQVQQLQAQHQQAAQQAAQTGQQIPPFQPPPKPNLPQPTPEMLDAMKEPAWEEVMQLLRDEKLRGFVVDVETDSTVEPDQQAQQESAVQFVTAVTQFMTAALPIVQAAPESASFIGEMLSWTTRQWKGADTIEGAVDEFVDQMEKAAGMPKPPPPEQMKAEAEVKKADAQVQVAEIGVEKAKIDLAGSQMEHQQDMQRLAFEAANPPPQQNGGQPA